MLSRFLIGFAVIFCFGGYAIRSTSANEIVRVDAREYPFSAIGRLNLGGRGYCSAVLVGPDLVLSAASCLYNRVEGRWLGHNELFFQGGYQFEKASHQAGIAAYATPKSYRPGKRLTLASVRVDFALLKLEQPIGNRAGWLGLRWNDGALENDRRSNRLIIHHAGYARDRQHVQIIDAGCNAVSFTCTLVRQRLALLPIAERDGGFFALPLRTKIAAGALAGFRRIAADMLTRLGYDEPETPAPRTDKRKPTHTVALLLRHLGYFAERLSKTTPALLIQGITAFQKDNGRRPDGEVSLQLLADMLRVVRNRGNHAS